MRARSYSISPAIRRAMLLLGALMGLSAGGLLGCKGNASGGASPIDEQGPCTPLAPVPRRIWRLSVQQYSNSVRDLLGLATGPTLDTTGGTAQAAFFSDASATVDENLAFQLNLAARKIVV